MAKNMTGGWQTEGNEGWWWPKKRQRGDGSNRGWWWATNPLRFRLSDGSEGWWWPKSPSISHFEQGGRGVKRRVLVGNKTPLSRVRGRCRGFQTEGDGGVAFERCGAKRRVVGTKPLHHSSARGVVHVERCWWCQTDSGGGQKSLRLTFERGWLWAEAAEPPSRVRATIVPLDRVGSVAQWWWCGWEHERNSCCRDRDLPSHWWLVEF